MIKKLSILYILLIGCLVAHAQEIFVHEVTQPQLDYAQHITTLDHSATNNNPDAVILVQYRHEKSPGNFLGIRNESQVGVWYNRGKWHIFNQDKSPLARGVKFNVIVFSEGNSYAKRHQFRTRRDKGYKVATTFNLDNASIIATPVYNLKYHTKPFIFNKYYKPNRKKGIMIGDVAVSSASDPFATKDFNVLIVPHFLKQMDGGIKLKAVNFSLKNNSVAAAIPEAQDDDFVFVSRIRNEISNFHNNAPLGVYKGKGSWTIMNADHSLHKAKAEFSALIFRESGSTANVKKGVLTGKVPGLKDKQKLHYVSVDDKAVYEYDQILGPRNNPRAWGAKPHLKLESLFPNRADLSKTKVSFNPTKRYLWEGGIMPYKINERDFSTREMLVIKNAIWHINKTDRVQMIPHKGQKDYVHIVANTNEIPNSSIRGLSYIGRKGGKQNLYIDRDTRHPYAVMHLIMHAFGALHEHSKKDRDNFITINWDDIKPEFHDYYEKNKVDREVLIDFNQESIMMVPGSMFKKSGQIGLTSAINGRPIGTFLNLTAHDKYILKKLYPNFKRFANGSYFDINRERVISLKINQLIPHGTNKDYELYFNIESLDLASGALVMTSEKTSTFRHKNLNEGSLRYSFPIKSKSRYFKIKLELKAKGVGVLDVNPLAGKTKLTFIIDTVEDKVFYDTHNKSYVANLDKEFYASGDDRNQGAKIRMKFYTGYGRQ